MSLTQDPAFKTLQDLFEQHGKKLKLADLFAQDPNRFNKYSKSLSTPDGDLLFDFSKNLIDEQILENLLNLARSRKVEEFRAAMFSGKHINFTEDRAVLHVALRDRSSKSFTVDGQNVTNDVNNVLAHMKQFTEAVISGSWKGYTGEKITDVVNIGIGGSDLVSIYFGHFNIC
uniref:Glucose-6-phosphate isomerase n=1 Tax=Acrobeloides nanus TaxID=290746 RepID=A0A914CWC2_9BILA